MRRDGDFLRAQFGLRLLQARLNLSLFALQRAALPAAGFHLFVNCIQRTLQFRDLVLTPKDALRILAVARGATGITPRRTQELTSQSDIVAIAVVLLPS